MEARSDSDVIAALSSAANLVIRICPIKILNAEACRTYAELLLDKRHLSLRRKENGSCIFLSADSQDALYKCSVYDFRPALCRLYPFQFKMLKEDSYPLKLITCCNGLNSQSGTIIDAKFAAEVSKSLLFELVDCCIV